MCSMEDATFIMPQVPAGQHAPPIVGSWIIAARSDDRPPAVLPPAVASNPQAMLAGAVHDFEHERFGFLASDPAGHGPDGVLLRGGEVLRWRQVPFVDQFKRHDRALLPCSD